MTLKAESVQTRSSEKLVDLPNHLFIIYELHQKRRNVGKKIKHGKHVQITLIQLAHSLLTTMRAEMDKV